MGVTQHIKRMDTMMIAANIRKLTRSELIYACVANRPDRCRKDGRDDLISGMEHYYPKYKLLTRIRDGAETVMSVLRRVCHADTMPVKGLLRGRLFFGFKIGAMNCKKLFA